MSSDKLKPPGVKITPEIGTPEKEAKGPMGKGGKLPALFRRLDWLVFGITTFLVFLGYYLTLAPDLTLEDSGELAVGSFYAGVPHPPGYPVWTIYTWLFTVLFPFSNIAWRVALSSAVAAAFACGLLALLVSRGSSLLLESIPDFKGLERRWESLLCAISGFVAGMLLGFNGFMWSQAVIVEVYTLSVLSFMGVLCCLLRWIYAPEQRRYLYWAWFLFGICFTNHQTLIVAAMGIEIAVLAAHPRLGRDLFLGNSVIYVAGLFLKSKGMLTSFDNNLPLFLIYNLIGLSSVILCGWLTVKTRQKAADWMMLGRDLLMSAGAAYALALVILQAGMIFPDTKSSGFLFFHVLGLGSLAGCGWLTLESSRRSFQVVTPIFKGLLWVALVYLMVSVAGSFSRFSWLTGSVPGFLIFHLIGLGVLFALYWQASNKAGLGSEVRILYISAFVWLLGASFYFYMPLASMTNPPMNWGYPRTVEGFIHALTRGQYDKTQPTDSVGRFVDQIGMYVEGAINEFSLVFLLLGVVPFFFYRKMQKRERAWLVGLTAIGICLALLLLILLNPNTDLQSRQQSRVFFTSSHIIVAICIGYGVALVGGLLATQYERHRSVVLWSAAAAVAIELHYVFLTLGTTELSLLRFSALLGLALAGVFTGFVLLARTQAPMVVFLALFAIMPARSILSHWADNEQRGHLFGYWFGHDMFTPPFGVYPEMDRDAILFGGTDPGRFNPTYMIFCESFIPPEDKPLDPKFDRRDVYIITQNALADGTYLSYIRAHYNRSTQPDPYFFSELLRSESERQRGHTNLLARAMLPLDRYFTDLGARIEARRREQGVYPPKEINTPTPEDSQIAFQDYIMDAQRRLQHDMQFPNEPRQIKPGEDVRVVNDKVQVSGQVAVMAINGLLTKVIFDKNPGHEFFLEESFPLDWMWPYLSPYGIILKINRKPLPALTEEMLDKDHQFWRQYSERLIGNWITYDTPVKEVCEFAERTYLRHDFTGFKGDRKFVRDDFAQKAFSKLRSAIGGVYAWRLSYECPQEFRPKTPADQQRLLKEADFALRQSFAFCPYSPEAVYKYVNLLLSSGRVEDAIAVAETSLKFDPSNSPLFNLVNQLKTMRGSQPSANPGAPGASPVFNPAPSQFSQLEQQFQASPTNLQLGLDLVSAYLQGNQSDAALQLLEHISARPEADVSAQLRAAQLYAQMGNRPGMETTLARLDQLIPAVQVQYLANTNDMPLAFKLVSAYLLTKKVPQALALVDLLATRPDADASTLYSAAAVYAQVTNAPKLEATLERLLALIPENPDVWYDLAVAQAATGKSETAIQSLQKAVALNDLRAGQPGARDLRTALQTDPRLNALRALPGFPKSAPGN